MRVALIAALAENRVIGRDNQLPWRVPADLKHFKALTMGKPIIMGRKTWESIGRPLPGRDNIVVTRDAGYRAEGCKVVHSVAEALQAAGDAGEAMIIGGANLYEQTLDVADRLYLTQIRAEVEGDARFPVIDMQAWREIERESHPADERNEFAYDFVVLERLQD
ncbi:MAG TPA: type 3 dihydrofolate reductase [Gammaproteobacteria bacterium]|nr:type 3 dihydrofolate reductase [Gammaproteobacteria bacterium]